MKKFLLGILSFVILLLAFYGVIWGRYIHCMRGYSFELPKNKTMLVIGDSQVQAAIDDSIVACASNVAQSHENYFTMLQRIKLYTEANPQIDTVVLGITPHTTAYFKDEFFSDFGYIDYVVKYYLPFMGIHEWWMVAKHDIADVASSLFTPIGFYWDVNSSYVREMGHFEVANYSHLAEDVAEGATRLTGGDIHAEVEMQNQLTVHYLHEIVDYCKEKGIKLIGLNTPVYHSREYMRVDAFYELMRREFSDIEMWDYMDAEIPDEYRRDVNHLNRTGADWMSECISKRCVKVY